MSKALNDALDAVGTMTEREVLEARYDAMPPEVARSLQPRTHPMHMHASDASFAKRQFRQTRRTIRSGRITDLEVLEHYRGDARYWARRWQKSRSAANAARLSYLADQVEHERTYE